MKNSPPYIKELVLKFHEGDPDQQTPEEEQCAWNIIMMTKMNTLVRCSIMLSTLSINSK